MKNNNIKIAISTIFVGLILSPLTYVHSDDDQLFGGSKDKDSKSEKKAEKQLVKDEVPIKKLPKVSPQISRNKIESVIGEGVEVMQSYIDRQFYFNLIFIDADKNNYYN